MVASFGSGITYVLGFLSLALVPGLAQSAIFGSDDRVEVGTHPRLERLSRSTAIAVSTEFIRQNPQGVWSAQFDTLRATTEICPEERFSMQPVSPVACTGVLVGSDLLLTAGHCMVNWTEVSDTVTPHCEAFAWMFDFKPDTNLNAISADQVYRCKKVVYANFKFDTSATGINTYGQDIALIQLDRKVTGREPLGVAKRSVPIGEPLTVVGYPSGLPVKATTRGRVLESTHQDYFRTDLDGFGGNSGSPVISSGNEILGLLVRVFPDADYVMDPVRACYRPNRCDSSLQKCAQNEKDYRHGTEVQRASAILDRLQKAQRDNSM